MMKGQKMKKKEVKYDREEMEAEAEEFTKQNLMKKAETDSSSAGDEEKTEEIANQLFGIPIAPLDEDNRPGVVFILEKASLEVAKVCKTYHLLNSDEHANFLEKNNRNPAEYRPDIVHQTMLMILDSPLNKAGRLRALYVRTKKGVLFEVKPNVRIPRTYNRFAGIMLQLLQKLSISGVGEPEKLMKVIKNPVTQYLPANSRKIGFSHSSEKLVDIGDYVSSTSDDVNLVFVVGAMAHGNIDKDYVDDFLSISGYPLSAADCISRICNAFEHNWKIVLAKS